jgi:hypothetical protein
MTQWVAPFGVALEFDVHLSIGRETEIRKELALRDEEVRPLLGVPVSTCKEYRR